MDIKQFKTYAVIILLLTVLVVPTVTHASWYNPSTWFSHSSTWWNPSTWFQKAPGRTVVNQTATVNSNDCVFDPSKTESIRYFDVSLATRTHVTSPLFNAVMDGNTSESINLINKGANVNEKIAGDKDGFFTPLMVASSIGATQITKCLLSKGADPMVASDQGENALMYGAENCSVDSVNAIIDSGADVNAKDKIGDSALYFAAVCAVSSSEKSFAMIHNLLVHGANPNVVSKSEYPSNPNGPGHNALETLALNSGNGNAIAELMKAGGTNSSSGLFMAPSDYAKQVGGGDKVSYDILVGETSPDITSLKDVNTPPIIWSAESNEKLGYKDAVAYCKNINGYRLPIKTELQIAFVNKEPGFSLDLYHTSDTGDGTIWSYNKGEWQKSNITDETKKYWLEQGFTPYGVVNMYNGIYYTSSYFTARARCIKDL